MITQNNYIYIYTSGILKTPAFAFVLARNSPAYAESRACDHKLILSVDLTNTAELVCIAQAFIMRALKYRMCILVTSRSFGLS